MSARTFVLAVALLASAPSIDADAVLVEQPIYSPGGTSLVTLDTTTGIEWADLSIAAAPTLAEAISTAEAAAGPGWSLATRAHLLGLVEPFLALPVYDGSESGLPSTDSRLLPIVLALGTNLYLDDRFYTEAIYAEGGGTAWGSIRYEWGSRYSAFALGLPSAPSGNPQQYFLVRAIPEPSAGILLGLGLVGLAGSRARTRDAAPGGRGARPSRSAR